MRCTKYNVGEVIPEWAKVDLQSRGILERVDATPSAGKIITESHGELIDGEWIEVIDKEMTAEEIASSTKPENLKIAENNYFDLIDSINTAESLSILYSDNSATILEKAQLLSMTKKAYYGTLLQNTVHEIEINGGSWSDLPNAPHNL